MNPSEGSGVRHFRTEEACRSAMLDGGVIEEKEIVDVVDLADMSPYEIQPHQLPAWLKGKGLSNASTLNKIQENGLTWEQVVSLGDKLFPRDYTVISELSVLYSPPPRAVPHPSDIKTLMLRGYLKERGSSNQILSLIQENGLSWNQVYALRHELFTEEDEVIINEVARSLAPAPVLRLVVPSSSFDDIIRQCYERLNVKWNLGDNADEAYLSLEEKNLSLRSHRLGIDFHSTASEELYEKYLKDEDTIVAVMLLGASGCGKTHAILKAALNKKCLYFTPKSSLLIKFSRHCCKLRGSYLSFEEEVAFREEVLIEYKKILTCRAILLNYLINVKKFTLEMLFYFQATLPVIDKFDELVYGIVSPTWKEELNHEDPFLGTDYFIAIDECQLYFVPPYDSLLRKTGVAMEKTLSLNRFFSWAAGIIRVTTILSGTALRMGECDKLGSGDKALEEYGIYTIRRFDYFAPDQVKSIALHLLEGKTVLEDGVITKMSYLLQGRPRILMNFFLECLRMESVTFTLLDSYVERMSSQSKDSDNKTKTSIVERII